MVLNMTLKWPVINHFPIHNVWKNQRIAWNVKRRFWCENWILWKYNWIFYLKIKCSYYRFPPWSLRRASRSKRYAWTQRKWKCLIYMLSLGTKVPDLLYIRLYDALARPLGASLICPPSGCSPSGTLTASRPSIPHAAGLRPRLARLAQPTGAPVGLFVIFVFCSLLMRL